MSIFSQLAGLALKGAGAAAAQFAGLVGASAAAEAATEFLASRFDDQSTRLTAALGSASDRAWCAVEVALAGRSWWDKARSALASTGTERAFREQVQAYLDANPLDGADGHGPDFRAQCLAQLQSARKAGILSKQKIHAEGLARQVGDLSRFGDPSRAVQAEMAALANVSAILRREGREALAAFLEMRPADGPPVLVAALRYFFQREVESDPKLFQGLAYAKLDAIESGQRAGFADLGQAIDQHAGRLEGMMDDIRSVVVRTHGDVLDIKAELARQGAQVQELGAAVLAALAGRQLERRALHGGDSLSIRDDDERRLVRDLVRRYRALPANERGSAPALLNAVGKLQVVAGEFEAAQRDFRAAAAMVGDGAARAEMAHNAYRAALERRAWDDALASLREASEGDPARFAPFPLDKFVPVRILGAGGFGVAFLCRNRHSGGQVVVKTLRGDGLGRAVDEVFREAQALEGLDHPAIIRIRDCDFADKANTRAYFVMDFFPPGQTLDGLVEQSGPLKADEALPMLRRAASGLEQAHARGILHRDIKPGNLLVRKDGAAWECKLIDFGLALRADAAGSTANASMDRTLAGSSVAGTRDYAAPEQMGKGRGASVGTWSDVYGWAKLSCFAMFGTPTPTFQHWQSVPRGLADLLGRCLSEKPAGRPQTFGDVLRELDRVGKPAPAPLAEPAKEVVPLRPCTKPERVREAAPAKMGSWGIAVLVFLGVAAAFGAGAAWVGRGAFHFGGRPRPAFVKPVEATPFDDKAIEPAKFPEALAELRKKPDSKRTAQLAHQLARTGPTPAQWSAHGEAAKHRLLGKSRAIPKGKLDEAEKDDGIAAVSKALEPLLKDESAEVRLKAVQALQRWGTPDNVPALREMQKQDKAHAKDIEATIKAINGRK